MLLCSLAHQVYAASVSLKVVDQHGAPIQNAVVSAQAQTAFTSPLSPAVMDQIDKQFLPHVLVIKKNQYVNFPNSDNIRHHVYSFSAPKPFEIRLFERGDAAPMQFEKPGIVTLGCNIHDQMIGYIYIADNETTAITDKNGLAELETSNDTLHLWHAQHSVNHSQRKQITLSGSPDGKTQVITLTLLSNKEDSGKRQFGTRKFGSKGE